VTGDVERALKAHEGALAIYREIGYPQGVANALGTMGLINRDKGDLDAAFKALEEALAI
jgi:tetratricopeptide (TPR) repeat protein